MIEIKARIEELSKALLSNHLRLVLEFDGNPADFEELINKDLRVSLKEWREKRSNDANSYFWVLLDKLSEKLRKSKTELTERISKICQTSLMT